METRTIEFYYDYVDPVSWVVDAWLARDDADAFEVLRRPLELRAPPSSLLAPDADDLVTRRALAAPYAERLGLALGEPTLIPWTRKAHELAIHAAATGEGDRVHRQLFAAHLSDGQDIGRVDVLVRLASEAGLDGSEAKAVLDVDRYLEAVREARGRAHAQGIDQVPSLRIDGQELYHFGAAAELLAKLEDLAS